MLKIYGSEMCPDCVACKKNFDFYHIEYEFIDINKTLKNLKIFLKLRDTLPVFDHCKEIGDIVRITKATPAGSFSNANKKAGQKNNIL